MFTARFWRDAAERAFKTACQMGLLALGTVVWKDFGDALEKGQAVGLAMLFGVAISLLTSVASINIGSDKASPSILSDDG